MNDGRTLVFGIGLNKTATTSLHSALEVLGYRSLHWGGPAARDAVLRALAEDEPLLRYLDPGIEAICDRIEVTKNFDLADRQYPGSRFVLTVRDVGDWLESRRRHVERNLRARRAGEYRGDFLEIDIEGWAAEYREHEARVRRHFSGRPRDLLTLDITGGDGWERLCPFLDRPVPEVPFPSRNLHPGAEA